MVSNPRAAGGLIALGAVFALIGSCIVQPAPPTAQPPYGQRGAQGQQRQGQDRQQPPSGTYAIPNGDYSCRIGDYSPFECRAWAGADGVQWLEKVRGSQRFRGRVIPSQAGFSFEGTYYCPYGSCTEDVRGEFTAYDDGLYRGSLRGARVTVVAFQFEPGGFGASGYGGLGYGGQTYGRSR